MCGANSFRCPLSAQAATREHSAALVVQLGLPLAFCTPGLAWSRTLPTYPAPSDRTTALHTPAARAESPLASERWSTAAATLTALREATTPSAELQEGTAAVCSARDHAECTPQRRPLPPASSSSGRSITRTRRMSSISRFHTLPIQLRCTSHIRQVGRRHQLRGRHSVVISSKPLNSEEGKAVAVVDEEVS